MVYGVSIVTRLIAANQLGVSSLYVPKSAMSNLKQKRACLCLLRERTSARFRDFCPCEAIHISMKFNFFRCSNV
eukprot:c35010_g1_i1 orf=172-393(+)